MKNKNSSGSSNNNNSSFQQQKKAKINLKKRTYGEPEWPHGSKVRHYACDGQPTMRTPQELQEKTCNISKTIALKCMDIQSTTILKCVSMCSAAATTNTPNKTAQSGKLRHVLLQSVICFKVKLGKEAVVSLLNFQTYKD